MPVTTHLFAYGLRQVLRMTEESASQIAETAGQIVEASGPAGKVIALVRRHFTDHSQTLPRALKHANERAWQALAISLAGDGLLDRLKAFVSGPAPKAIQQQVKAFLTHNAQRYETTSEEIRRACLSELHQARKKGLLSAVPATDDIARQAAAYRGLADPRSLLTDARQAANGVADALPAEYSTLAQLLRQGASEGQPPLLVVAFAHFFRREIQTNEELARGLTYDLLQRLVENQESALNEVGHALASMGGRFDDLLGEVLEQLGRMESKLDDIREQQADIRARLEDLARRKDVQRESSKSRFQITITNEREQALARALLEEVRKLPPEAQSADLLTLMGDVLRAAGRFKDAQESYTEASKHSSDKAEKAASLHKAYLTSLEQKRWDEALQALTEAAALEPQKYAPFPLHQYQVKRILGAGGFGAVFLCQDKYMQAEVVVKGLYNTDMERSLEDAFREAHVLRHLSREHASIIGVQHCSYADESQTRPYIVMDYFPGVSLQAFLDDLDDKPLPLKDFQPIAWQIAVGMKAAHDKGVLHRDLKPDNVLVRREEDGWQVRIIDFGLAIKTRLVQVSTSVPLEERTLAGECAAGTARYASPEQLGEFPGVEVGPYSDVYAFGKLCCYALFQETEPKTRHWKSIPEALAGMLEKCIERQVRDRHASFEPVLKVLESMASASTQQPRKELSESSLQDSDWQGDVRECERQDDAGEDFDAWIRERAPERFQAWLVAAKSGAPAVQWLVGRCYALGVAARQDDEVAISWYTRAAKKGYTNAFVELGRCYWYGCGASFDLAKGTKWFRKAAKKNSTEGQIMLGGACMVGWGTRKDKREATRWLGKALAGGGERTQIRWRVFLSCCFDSKEPPPSRPPNSEKRPNSQQFFTDTLQFWVDLLVGVLAWRSQSDFRKRHPEWAGIPSDDSRNVELLHQAAEKGDSDAQILLCKCYLKGEGVAIDREEASRWLTAAAATGNAESQYLLTLNGFESSDKERRIEWLRKAAAQGHAPAQLALGSEYFVGRSVEQDDRIAAEWLRKAAAQGEQRATMLLRVLAEAEAAKRPGFWKGFLRRLTN